MVVGDLTQMGYDSEWCLVSAADLGAPHRRERIWLLGWRNDTRSPIPPTPVASMSKGSSPNALQRRSGASRSKDRLDHAVMSLHGGQLNPTWVEWLMGWPLGWTDLKPLGMDRFREWQRQHSTGWIQGSSEVMP